MPKSRVGTARSLGLLCILAAIAIDLLLFLPVFAEDAAEPQPVDSAAGSVFSKAQQRIDRDVEVLSKESTEETLERLSQVGMFFWPGVPGEEPLTLDGTLVPSDAGERDVSQLIGCRRLVKAYQNLAALPQPEATALVNRHLKIARDEYTKLYQDYLETAKRPPAPDKGIRVGPSFAIGGTDKPTLLGYRLKTLGLVFLAGNLELKGAAPAVLAVARQATEDYENMRSSDKGSRWYWAGLVERGGLYSRQALAVGLIGTLANRDDPVAAKYRGKMQVVRWTEFNGRLTPFDQPAMWGGVPVPKKPLKFRSLGELTDADLAEIVAAASH